MKKNKFLVYLLSFLGGVIVGGAVVYGVMGGVGKTGEVYYATEKEKAQACKICRRKRDKCKKKCLKEECHNDRSSVCYKAGCRSKCKNEYKSCLNNKDTDENYCKNLGKGGYWCTAPGQCPKGYYTCEDHGYCSQDGYKICIREGVDCPDVSGPYDQDGGFSPAGESCKPGGDNYCKLVFSGDCPEDHNKECLTGTASLSMGGTVPYKYCCRY